MKMKQLFFGAATVCMLAAAALMVQSATTGQANAGTGLSEGKASLLDRVKELELQQVEDSHEFVLIDATLTDMDTKFEAKLMDLRNQLNDMEIPVKQLLGDEIGIPFKASSFRHGGPDGSLGIRNPAGKRQDGKGVTLPPGGNGW